MPRAHVHAPGGAAVQLAKSTRVVQQCKRLLSTQAVQRVQVHSCGATVQRLFSTQVVQRCQDSSRLRWSDAPCGGAVLLLLRLDDIQPPPLTLSHTRRHTHTHTHQVVMRCCGAGFAFNLLSVLLKLCKPFFNPDDQKAAKIDWRYTCTPQASPSLPLVHAPVPPPSPSPAPASCRGVQW